MSSQQLKLVTSADEKAIQTAQTLFREYEAWLDLDLCFQGFESELASLPGRYAAPNGALWLAMDEEIAAGCVALREIEPQVAEMKRLYVRPSHRGKQIGKLLIETVIETARMNNCRSLRLDTFPPKMEKAVQMYRSYGFREIDAYYENPNPETLFMELDLSKV